MPRPLPKSASAHAWAPALAYAWAYAMACALASLGAVGCVGVITAPIPPDGGSEPDAGPIELGCAGLFTAEVQPILLDEGRNNNGCIDCHGAGAASGAPLFLGSDDLYNDLRRDLRLLSFLSPRESLLINYPGSERHMVQVPFKERDREILTEWIACEANAFFEGGGMLPGMEPTYETELGPLTGPIHTLALDSAGAPGAVISYEIVRPGVGSSCLIDNIRVFGGELGVHLVHPLFVFVRVEGTGEEAMEIREADPTDRFASLDLTVASGRSLPLALDAEEATTSRYFASNCEIDGFRIVFDRVEPVDRPMMDAGM